jgi:hypothetical protein
MKKVGLTQRHQTEKAIIDALLKISEIIQKTETNRKSINANKCSKKTVGDGDYNEFYDDNEQQQVPTPPPMRTLDSYVSGFNQYSLQKPSNCNQASTHKPKQCDQSSDSHSYKRHYCDISSASSSSNDHYHHHQKKSSKHSSFQSNKNSQSVLNSQTTSYQINSAATTIPDDQSSSLIMMPIVSAPTITIEQQQPSINPTPPHIEQQQQQQQFSSPSDILTNPKTDFDLFIDQQLQTTLEKCLKNHLLSSTKMMNENIQQQQKTRLSKSETGKLIDELDFTKQSFDLEHYEKQVKKI